MAHMENNMDQQVPRRSTRSRHVPAYLRDYITNLPTNMRVMSDPAIYHFPEVEQEKRSGSDILLGNIFDDRISIQSKVSSKHSIRSKLSLTSVLSDSQAAELQYKKKQAEYLEMKRQVEEEQRISAEFKRLDNMASKAQQEAERKLEEAREISRQTAKEREALNLRLARERKLREAEFHMKEAQLVASMIQTGVSELHIEETKTFPYHKYFDEDKENIRTYPLEPEITVINQRDASKQIPIHWPQATMSQTIPHVSIAQTIPQIRNTSFAQAMPHIPHVSSVNQQSNYPEYSTPFQSGTQPSFYPERAPTQPWNRITTEPSFCPERAPTQPWNRITTEPSFYPERAPSQPQNRSFNDLLLSASYGIPKPNLPFFSSGKERDFARLEMAFRNLIDIHTHLTEQYKFQVLLDKLGGSARKLAEAYRSHVTPYTMAFRALKERYGQPRQLVQSELNYIMNLPQIRYGDSEGFDNFALSVHSLVGLLQSVDGEDSFELRCGSHVDRLMNKLPALHRDNFIEHCLNRGILTAEGGSYTLIDFSNWLQVKARAKRIATASASNSATRPEKQSSQTNSRPRQEKSTQRNLSPTSVFNTNTSRHKISKYEKFKYCPYCNNNDHFLHTCPKFSSMSSIEVRDWIKKGSRCYRCARFHKPEDCTLKKPCHECDGLHLTALHEFVKKEADKVYTVKAEKPEPVYADHPLKFPSVMLKVVKVLLHGPNDVMETYALLDDGSMRTMILQPAVKQLELPSSPDKVLLTTIRSDPFWCTGQSVDLQISSTDRPDQKYSITGAFSADNLCISEYTYPVRELQSRYPHLKDLPLPNITQARPMILIGSDYADLILPQKPVVPSTDGSPAAILTSLGWTLQGPTKDISRRSEIHTYLTSTEKKCSLMSNVERLWQMDILPYSEKKVVRSKQDMEALELLETQTEKVDVDGIQRYATPLLRANDSPKFETTKLSVTPALRRTEKRLTRNPQLASKHDELIQKLVSAGYVKVLTEEEASVSQESWYFPHHVIEQNGKYRLVFNCSFNFKGISLNTYLRPGPVLGPTLLGVLLRLRQHQVAISGDIQAMFHQVRVVAQDRPLLRFIWRNMETSRPPDTYEWQVLPFGTTCSPCCATYALQRQVIDNTETDSQLRQTVTQSFYVDNCLDSKPTASEAKELLTELRSVLANGGFNIRQWCSNLPSVVEDLPTDAKSDACELWLNLGQEDTLEGTLGLQWQCKSDNLCYKVRKITYHQLNMRMMYKILASQYDPLGYLSPYLVRAKMIVQDLWKNKIDWDTPIESGTLCKLWREWENELEDISKVKLPRCYTPGIEPHENIDQEIHVFCDASERVYGAVAYLRTVTDDQTVIVNFLAARSRVAPKKQQTIPRLELSAALTGAQLADVINKEITLPIKRTVLWSDSTTVLAWLHSESCRYKVFVGTRVAEVQTLTNVENWHYVKSKENPADSITLGITLRELSKDRRWSHGPTYLSETPDKWPKMVFGKDIEKGTDETELKKAYCGTIIIDSSMPAVDYEQFSSWDTLVSNSTSLPHGAANESDSSNIVERIEEFEDKLFRQIQTDSFPDEIYNLMKGKEIPSGSRLLPLSPVYDKDCGLIRIGGRLRHADCLTDSMKYPIILDPHHHLTKLLIKKYDDDLLHPGPERVLAEMRRKFWIVRGREAIRKCQHECTECRRWRGKPEVPKMNDLPPSRLRLYKPVFYSTGIDCFGPLTVKIGRRVEKRWGVIFKCMTTRAVHIDLLEGLDTDAFLMAFRRFVSRRGKPFEILSDQGTNFKGADSELQKSFSMMEPTLIERLSEQRVRWKYNPPNSPHFGGVWEREIKSLKTALRVVLRDHYVTEAVLQTVLIEIEGILNSKPLGYISSDARDIDPITPNLLLMGRRDPSLPQVVYPASKLMGRRRWRHSQVIADQFWSHFIHYYLPDLQLRRKWTRETDELTLGDIVLVVDPQLSRAQWPVGRVTETFPSHDGRVRAARVCVGEKQYERPVVRLVRLPELID